MNSENDTISRLGGEPRWKVRAGSTDTKLWSVEGRSRRVRRQQRTMEIAIDLAAPSASGRGSWPTMAETGAAKSSFVKRVAALAMGADVRPDLLVHPWNGGIRFLFLLRFTAGGRSDLISEAAASAFAEGVAPFCDREVSTIERQMERREDDNLTVDAARRYLSALVTEARAQGDQRIDYETRLDALRRERGEAVLAEVDRMVAADELRSSLTEQREDVDERALVAAYRLARKYAARPANPFRLPSSTIDVPEAEILGEIS